MNIRVLGCHGGELPRFRTTSFLINRSIVLDAGAITGVLDLQEQIRIQHIILTHAHADHSRDLMFLADNVIGAGGDGFTIYSISPVLKDIKRYLFNWHICPDLTELPTKKEPIIKMKSIGNKHTAQISGVKVTLCMVNHTVPTAGVIIDDDNSSVVFSGDTAPTDSLWEMARKKKNLKAMFIECSYPNGKKALASLSKHLTPGLLGQEVKKIRKDIKIYVYHIKPQFYKQVVKELKQEHLQNMKIVRLNEVIKI
jgi:ribonuclease BN (tRNA processing enzyme)